MSEEAPTYFVRDYCAVCGKQLVVQANGTRIACHPVAEHVDGQASQMYWSEAVPLPADLRGFMQLTGREPRMQTECIEPGTGRRHDHAPLFLYRRIGA